MLTQVVQDRKEDKLGVAAAGGEASAGAGQLRAGKGILRRIGRFITCRDICAGAAGKGVGHAFLPQGVVAAVPAGAHQPSAGRGKLRRRVGVPLETFAQVLQERE